MAKAPNPAARNMPDLPLPLISVEGTLRECGVQLGSQWRGALHLESRLATGDRPWWKDRRYTPLIARYAPHLPDLYCAMAAGAGLDENQISTRAPAERAGCTSWALQPAATLDGIPLSGQSKDISHTRGMQLQVLRLKASDAPSMLTLTYPGWLFGHGFVTGGTSILRNALYVPQATGLPHDVWGILCLHCPTVEAVMELSARHRYAGAGHMTVADERGGIVGIEMGEGGPAFLRPKKGIYTHANCILSGNRKLRRAETGHPQFTREDSLHRTRRLRDLFEQNAGRLTVPLAYAAHCDHTHWPVSICRHESRETLTGGVVIVEPTRGTLYATRGNPCQTLLQKFTL